MPTYLFRFSFDNPVSLILGNSVSKLCSSLVSCASPIFLNNELIKVPFKRDLKDATSKQILVTGAFQGLIELKSNYQYLLTSDVDQVILPAPINDLDIISLTDYTNSWGKNNKLYIYGSLEGKAGTCLDVKGSTLHLIAQDSTWRVLDWGYRKSEDTDIEYKYKVVQYENGQTDSEYYFRVEARGYINDVNINTEFIGETSQVNVCPSTSDVIWTTFKDSPILGPIVSVEIVETLSPPFDVAFENVVVLNPKINGTLIELDFEKFRYKYENSLIFTLPPSSALIRELSVKAINVQTDKRDSLEVDSEVLEIISVSSTTKPSELYKTEYDFTIEGNKIVPTIEGRIDDGEVLAILYR